MIADPNVPVDELEAAPRVAQGGEADRRLAGAGLTDECQHAARFDDEIDVERAREAQQPVGVARGDRVTRRERRDAAAAGCGVELVE